MGSRSRGETWNTQRVPPEKNERSAAAEAFLRFAAGKLEQLSGRILEATDALPDAVFWRQDNPATNSVAQLMIHLTGNIRQWILAGVAGVAERRDREAEFVAQPGERWERAAVRARWVESVEQAVAVIRGLEEERLPEIVRQQGYEVTVLEDIFHVVEHFAYHAGQIFLLVKLHSEKDLGFYQHLVSGGPPESENIP